jgi:hypothetical protein
MRAVPLMGYSGSMDNSDDVAREQRELLERLAQAEEQNARLLAQNNQQLEKIAHNSLVGPARAVGVFFALIIAAYCFYLLFAAPSP